MHLFSSRFASLALAVFWTAAGTTAAAQAPPSAEQIGIKTTSYPVPTDGTARYVKPDGDDAQDGRTLATAWRTVSKALSAPVGSTIVLKGGTYRDLTGPNLNRRLTFQPAAGEQVWIKGSVQIPNAEWAVEGGRWVKTGWTTEFQRVSQGGRLAPCPKCIDADHPEADYRDMVFVNGVRQQQVLRLQDLAAGTFYVDAAADKLYVGSDPRGKTVEATVASTALQTWNAPAAGSVFRGLGFAHFAEMALVLAVNNLTVENCTFAWNGEGGGIGFPGGGSVLPEDNVVRGSTFTYNAQQGLGGAKAHRLLLEGNVFSHNNVELFARIWSAAGFKITNADGQVVRNNIIEDNDAHGAWLDVDTRNATVVGNVARRNTAFGIFFEISRGCLIAGNVCVGNGVGIGVANSSDARLYNNTLVSNNKALLIKEDNRTPTPGELAAGASYLTRRTVVKNNILADANSGILFDTYRACSDTAKAMITALDYNAYYRAAASQPATLVKWNVPQTSRNCHTFHAALPAFAGATGFEGKGFELSGAPNPFFVNPAADGAGDYRLKGGSSNPAHRRGQPLPQDVARLLGVPAGVPVDLGAYPTAGAVTASTQPGHPDEVLTLYPNPATNTLTVRVRATAAQAGCVELLDVLARPVVRRSVALRPGENAVSVDVSQLRAGVYFVRVHHGQQSANRRLVVTH
ncbi:right-handed parallel beta-helix repeat-containing protein [Hymenobacter weizhouensis]|uniref:right-handed parallel beta-helix repeat-containing protein n=1 Tax=Hymenobacter sp. YIM 151500-1 TaxID=2987689 RepID=UPI00222622F4|nr:right-handed parallel beta-helix repeat-containing protein [Hymenobacter sp. YIM 151500-1]UYZ63733.1 right-handed parallel beta-helix repeat-containing protein [Hymenobacter sp. YIM 151500-1]